MSEPPTAEQFLLGTEDVKPQFPLDPQLYQPQPQAPQEQHTMPQQQQQSPFDVQYALLSTNPHDPAAWRKLINIAEGTGEIDKIRAAYDALLRQYPNTSSAQIAYITHFLNDPTTFTEAEDLFKKFLRTSPSVDLWGFYLTYVRRLNSGTSTSTRDTVRKSYEFALNHVGQDKDSGEIWNDYIQFLKAGEVHTSTWEEQQKMDALRKVYHRAVQIPLENVEKLWAELESFETNLNRITAKKFMADLSPAHMQARTVLRQLNNHLGFLYPEGTTEKNRDRGAEGFYLPGLPTFDGAERMLIGKWKGYLKWEEGNPLEIEEKDRTTLITRVQGVYRKAMVRMRYYTEIWFMAYIWTCGQGLDANPGSFLLTFAYAEAQESKKELTDVHGTFEKFLSALRANLEQVEAANASSVPRDAHLVNGGAQQDKDKGKDGENKSDSSSSDADEKEKKSTELAELRTEYGLAWIMYMRFGRRAEGVKSSRAIFGKARKDKWTPWEVYEAAALMEYHCSDDKQVASRIFEKGMDFYADEIEFVLRYLGFLISINDENNARALFERVINSFPADKARPLWERWARYEYQYGDLEASQKLEKRIAEVYPSDPPIKLFAQRHIYLGTDAIAARDLGVAMARKSSSQSSVAASNQGGAARSDTQANMNAAAAVKRPPSPDYPTRKRDESRGGEYSQGHKRMRGMSPPRGDRDRDRWDGPGAGGRRRYSPPPPPPVWEREERERGRGGGGPPPRAGEREEEKPRIPAIPAVISNFIGSLPPPSQFDGPVFRTEDLMNLFRNAVIPSSNRSKSPPPPPAHRGGGGRPPPDYSPYTGPSGGGRSGGRRY
ncbi:hypothetical protein BDQ17DRAFT_1361005 [Cyathus striatus]|nr:hypothetical protein BDQ17DRAFT_1361005 [Cyathus striatus]